MTTMSADDLPLFQLRPTLFERLNSDPSGQVLRQYVARFVAEKRALEHLVQRTPLLDTAAREILTLEDDAFEAAEKIVLGALRAFNGSAAITADAPDPGAQAGEHKTTNFLLTTALLGVEMKYYAAVRTLLDVLIEIKPDLALAKLLHAHLLCRVSDGHEGRRELLQLIEDFPGFHLASAMLAVEDRDANVAGWRGLAESVVEQGGDETSKKLVSVVLSS
jgi:hypothetical protein